MINYEFYSQELCNVTFRAKRENRDYERHFYRPAAILFIRQQQQQALSFIDFETNAACRYPESKKKNVRMV